MDRVFIEELTVFAQIGVYDWEQQIKQKLVFDLEMTWDCKQAAETDDVAYCLNYAEVSQVIIDYVESKPFLLLESRYQLQGLKIKLSKPKAVAQARNVGVLIVRGCLK